MAVSGRPHNRRAFPRWKAQFEVRYGNGSGMQPARGYQIGQTGLGFITAEPPQADCEIEVAYRLDPSEDWTQVRAIVRNSGGHMVGAEFLNIRLADRLRIVDFIAKHPDEAD